MQPHTEKDEGESERELVMATWSKDYPLNFIAVKRVEIDYSEVNCGRVIAVEIHDGCSISIDEFPKMINFWNQKLIEGAVSDARPCDKDREEGPFDYTRR
jgi:hypothetical protein